MAGVIGPGALSDEFWGYYDIGRVIAASTGSTASLFAYEQKLVNESEVDHEITEDAFTRACCNFAQAKEAGSEAVAWIPEFRGILEVLASMSKTVRKSAMRCNAQTKPTKPLTPLGLQLRLEDTEVEVLTSESQNKASGRLVPLIYILVMFVAVPGSPWLADWSLLSSGSADQNIALVLGCAMVNSGRTTYGPDASNPQGNVYAYHEVSQNAAGSPGFAGDQYSTAIDVQGQGYIPATQQGQPVEGSQCQAIANMFCTKLNILLVFVPLGIVSHYQEWGPLSARVSTDPGPTLPTDPFE
ncbi:hypothetical protein AK812_SmicGene156 [Symbiodinium microadriaticum]|uniref:Uncharacterized protein n=1 Tax=Symbiodinium microadriaticum TaxID=2951 RepID=A0A1Q9F7B4_SYMMI|nr:hypothetical protein AK812_SmicGene156 [Symbiodinium microadriaticum]